MSWPEALSDFGQTKNPKFSCRGTAEGTPVFAQRRNKCHGGIWGD